MRNYKWFGCVGAAMRRLPGVLAPNLRTTEKCGIIGPTQKEAAEMGRKSEFSREEKIAAVKLVTEGGRSALSKARSTGSRCWKKPARRSGSFSS